MKYRTEKITRLALALALGAGLGASHAKAQTLPVTNGLKVWLSADGVNPADPTQVDGSGNVQQWNDLSGNNHHASNATASERPAYISSAMNGKPVLRFIEANSSKLLLGDLSASFWATLPADPTPTAVNSGAGGAALDGTYANIPTRGVAGALVGDGDTATAFAPGSSHQMSIPFSAQLNPSGPFTAEIWAKPNGSGTTAIMSSGDFGATRTGWIIYATGANWDIRLFTGNGTTFSGFTTPLTLNAWQHLALVHDGAGGFQFYVNGVAATPAALLSNGTASGTVFTPAPGFSYVAGVAGYTAVAARWAGASFLNLFDGTADEFAMYGTALSAARIQAHFENGMNAPTPRTQPYSAEVLADAPVGYYRLNEPAGPMAAASFFAVAAPNNDGRYNLFGNRANDDRWVADTWTESSPGSFRGARAAFAAAGYALWPQSGAHVFSLESSPSRYRFVINGNQNPTLSAAPAYNSGAGTNWTIGDSAAGNDQRLNGDIAELLLFNRVLTTLEANQVGGYLTQKYGLTTTYPPLGLSVKLNTPVDTLAYPNGTAIEASASVVAGSVSAGTPPYTVEFFVDNVSIGTANTVDPYTRNLGALTNGSHTIYAKVTDSTSPTPITATSATHTFSVVAAVSTTTTLTSSANPSTYGSDDALIVTVTTSDSSLLTGGTVQFFDAGAPLGAPVPVDTVTGEAVYNSNTLGAGTHPITATYSGFGGKTASSAPALAQVVQKAPLTVTANNVFRPTETSDLDPLPHKITGFQNGQTRATSGVTGQPLLTTPGGPASPVGTYPITCALGSLASANYSFMLVNGTLTVADVPDIFSINFFVGPEWPYGGLGEVGNEEAKEALKIEPGMPAGFGDWFTNGWHNYLVPWAPTAARPPVTLTSNRGSSASFTLLDCRNGWTYSGTARTTLVGDGNGNMMDAHVNSTLDPDNGLSNSFKMELKDIPFPVYDVIFYLGASQAQFGDGKGTIVVNDGQPRDFTLKPGAFDGSFTEMVDATTLGNYIVFKGVTGSTFTAQTYGKGPNGFNHIGPFGIQIRSSVTDYGSWAQGFPGANLDNPNADLDGDGWTNDEERLFGLNPTDGSSVNPIQVPLDSTAGTFSFTRRDRALTGKFTDIETSTDLQLWTVDSGAALLVGAPDANGVQRVDVTLSNVLLTAPKLFVRVSQRDARVPLSANFEAGNGGFTVLTTRGSDWAWGDPDSVGSGGSVIQGNGGSTNCWGTNIGNPGVYLSPTLTCLRSVEVDLTNVAAAQLMFAEALDMAPGDTAVVNILDSTTNAIIAAAIYTATESDESLAKWAVANAGSPIPIPAAAIGRKVRIEWCLTGQTPEYIGWYIDDVTVQEVAP